MKLPLTQPALRPLVAATLGHLATSDHRWARALAWVLRTRVILICPLAFRLGGITNPFFPLILLDRKFFDENMQQGDAGRANIMQTLLHEAAHQLWAVWPEWRNWIGDRSHYGPERNAADAIAESIMRERGLASHYAGREISYVSPLRRLRLLKH